MAIELLSATPEILLFILWILLFNWWFKSEGEDMTILLGILFTPYSIFFAWYALPLLGLTHWLIYFFFIAMALIVGIFCLDIKYNWRGRK